MPLRVIKRALREEPERVRALIELEDRILESALASVEGDRRVSRSAVAEQPARAAARTRRVRRVYWVRQTFFVCDSNQKLRANRVLRIVRESAANRQRNFWARVSEPRGTCGASGSGWKDA